MKTLLPKHLLCLLLLGSSLLAARADIPTGYYNSLNGKSNAELKAAVREIVYNHTELNYNGLPSVFEITDVYPDVTPAQWWDMYSNIPIYLPWSGQLLNREHAFPKSWWGGLTSVPAYTDINHLYPAEAKANQAKSNWPLGEVATPSDFDNDWVSVGPAVTGQGGGAIKVFEPNDEYKGDFARTYFYMVTTYCHLTWTEKYMWMMNQNDYPTLKPWAVEMLLRWHREDPVSQKETTRNEAVYRIQGNRNPFIDHPDLAEHIWGNKMGVPFDVKVDSYDEVQLIAPAEGTTLDFTQVAIGSTVTSPLFIRGTGLTGNLRLQLYTGDTGMFSLGATSVPASEANSAAGVYVDVSYTPTELGSHSSRVLISAGGLGARSYGVSLLGECLPVPTLATLTATAPTEVEATQYVANWLEPSEGTAPDYYIVTRTRHIGTASFTDEVEAEAPGVVIDNFEDSDYDTYTVQSCSLGYRSEPSNEIRVDRPGGIDNIPFDPTLDFIPVTGGVIVMIGRTPSPATIIDPTGRTILTIPALTDGLFIPLPSGIYIISTPAAPPAKLILP